MYYWKITIEHYKEVLALALAHGKKAGESMEEEFLAVMKKYEQKPICETDKNIKEIKKELENKGFNILDLTKENKDGTQKT